jgi:hypothetical protein
LINGSGPLINGSGCGPAPDPALFVNDLQDANKKEKISFKFECLILFEGGFTSFIKDKKS